jgi:hypothetical protein
MSNDTTRTVMMFELSDAHGWAQAWCRVRTADQDDDITGTYTYNTPAAGFQAYTTGFPDENSRPDAFKSWDYGVEPQGDRGGAIGETEAERILKIMRKVRSATDKIASEYGEPGSFGTYVMRAAKVLGIKEIGFYKTRRPAWDTSTSRYRFLSLKDGASHNDHQLWSWREQCNEYAKAA